MGKKFFVFLPLFFSLVFIAGIYLGKKYRIFSEEKNFEAEQFGYNKVNEILNYVTGEYVDSVDREQITDDALNSLLQNLDPHSVYISADELTEMNEPLEGNFDGIGIEFNIINDTIIVISPISGGPSESLGILAGDRIVIIEDKPVAGTGITSKDVIQKLRGRRGSKVNIAIERTGIKELIYYTITRDKIPINSVDVSYLLNDSTGYIKISRFAANTYEEFKAALDRLLDKNIRSLVIDVRNNPGGYLNAAVQIADEFLKEKELIVYTEGKARPRNIYRATSKGRFEQDKLVILVDEGSASASEILAGAVQDNDRGIIVGRRSFGKGLVQEQSVFPDGSAVRLTVARYYTPSGRSIQRSYAEGTARYYEQFYLRYSGDNRYHPDSASVPDSLKYYTSGGRMVSGDGGINPDIFVPADSTGYSAMLAMLINKGIINRFAFRYADQHRKDLSKYRSVKDYILYFNPDNEIMNSFFDFARLEGVNKSDDDYRRSGTFILTQLKAMIARHIWGNDGFYPVFHRTDQVISKSKEIIAAKTEYSRILAYGSGKSNKKM